MAEKERVTMRDIAAACGVSLATVSGALNYSHRESIRDEVRLRVIRTATRMHYRPAPRREREGPLSAGILLGLGARSTPGKRMLYSDLATQLANGLQKRGFLPMLWPTENLDAAMAEKTLRKLDAWLMIDLDEAAFGRGPEGFYGPVLLLEAEVDDTLYCKILPDYPAIYLRAGALLGGSATFLAMEEVASRSLRQKLTAPFAPANVFINRPGASLAAFLERQRGRRGIVLGDWLAMEAAAHFPADDFVAVCRLAEEPAGAGHWLLVENARSAQAAVDTLCAMLDFDYTGNETNHILIDPK